MSKFKVGDLVRVIRETQNRYVGEVDTIEEIGMRGTTKTIYLKGCHLMLPIGIRLFFTHHELELVKSQNFYWLKKSNDV